MEAEVEWGDDLDTAFDDLEADLSDVVRGLTVEIWNGILAKTPQFYGRMAASWTYSIGKPHYEDRSRLVLGGKPEDFGRGPLQALWRGHRDAIAVAHQHSAGADRAFRLGDEVWIANGVDHGEGPYSAAIENGEVFLRMMNRPGTPVARTLDGVHARYNEGISLTKALRLKQLTIGVSSAANGDS